MAYAANPHVAATVEGSNCSQCHVPHQATVGENILNVQGDPDELTPVTFCYGCHDGTSAVNVKTGLNNVAFDGLSGHSVEAAGDGGDLTDVCSDCHDPHADSVTEFRIPKSSITVKLPGNVTVDREVTGADNSWCFACHDDTHSWYCSRTAQPYPSVSAPLRAANGYPIKGTFPGATIYAEPSSNAHANIPAGSMSDWAIGSREATRVAGDCLWCHSGHRGKSEYDGLVDTFGAPKDPASADDLVDGDYAAVCFRCHAETLAEGIQFEGSPVVADIASSALATDAAPINSNGHRVRSESSTLPQDTPLPCYECHNPHGSANGNTRLISDTLGSSLDVSTDAGMRAFCFTCHTSSDPDGDGNPYGWDSDQAAYAGVTEGEGVVVGLDRATQLRLSNTFGHASSQVEENCLTACHDDVHAPVTPTASTSCFSGGCHSALQGMVDGEAYTENEMPESEDPDDLALLGIPVYHHVLNGVEPDRGPGEEQDYPAFDAANQELYCISCHVGHDDSKAGGGRAYNLRDSGTAASPEPSNTDEGLCLSCHSYTLPFRINRSVDGITPTPSGQADNVLPATSVMRVEDDMWGYEPDPSDPSGNLVPEADRSPHNYQVSTYLKGDSEFKGNCAKCHGVLTPGQYGEATPFAFTVHFSPEQRLLNALGQDRNAMTIAADGQTATINEEDMCFRCHSNSTEKCGTQLNYTEYDYYGEQLMGEASRKIGEQMDDNEFGHKPYTYYKKHLISSVDETQEYLGTVVGGVAVNQHVECADCHNHHVVGKARHVYGTDNRVSDAIKGVRGVGFKSGELTNLALVNWPTTDPISFGSGVNDELEYKQMATYEYEICFKCHSSANADSSGNVALGAWGGKMEWTNWAVGPFATSTNTAVDGWTNVAQDFNVGNNSRHPVFATLSGYYFPDAEATAMVKIAGYEDTAAYGTSSLDDGQVSNGWSPNDTMMCSDCHGDSEAPMAMVEDGSGGWKTNPLAEDVPQGPHGASIRFSLRGPATDWPVRTDLATPRPIILADFDDADYDNIFCTNCHPAARIASNRAHSAGGANHPPLACVSCHVVVPHGSKMSRLVGDRESMPARYAYQGDVSTMLLSSFTKATGTYVAKNCSVAAGSACNKGQHRGVTGDQTGLNTNTADPNDMWENW
ncbi:MAG: cytochrome c3 family protein [Coriobacteriia bacterium]|nr:cytochrome c3 family protein [Coriobacteriia bacterium]